MLRKVVLCVSLAVLVLGLLVFVGGVGSIVAAGEGNEIVEIPDPNLEAVIREEVGKPSGDITVADMERLVQIDARSAGISDLEGIQYARNLWSLDIGDNEISNIEPLAELRNLLYLDISNNKVCDIKPLSGLTSLIVLDLRHNEIGDIEPLAGLTNLESLYLSFNKKISDVGPLAGLTNLGSLGICDNEISDIMSLSGLTNLEYLNIGCNKISNVEPLAGLTNLETLLIDDNEISDIKPLSGLMNLQNLNIGYNKISNIEPLSKLTSLKYLDMVFNYIGNIEPLLSIVALEEVNVNYNFLDFWTDNINKSVLDALSNNGVYIRPWFPDENGYIRHAQLKLRVEHEVWYYRDGQHVYDGTSPVEEPLMLQVGESVQLVVGYHRVFDDGEHWCEDDGLFTIGVDLDALSVNVSRPSVVSATMSAVANSDWGGIRHYLEIEALQPGETTVTVALGDSFAPFSYLSFYVVVVSEEKTVPDDTELDKPSCEVA